MINKENCNEIRSLILKSITDELTEAEKHRLDSWIMEANENRLFYEEITSSEQIAQQIEEFKKEDYRPAFNKFLKKKKEKGQKKVSRIFFTLTALAATVIIAVLIGYRWLEPISDNEELVALEKYDYKSTFPQLTLFSGETINLEKSISSNILHQKGLEYITIKRNNLVYTKNEVKGNLKYNILRVPNKMKYCVILSDGTKAWLNSESTLKHPIAFNNKERKVYVTGEVIFEVAKNKNKPFIVVAKGMNIKVTGTIFDIKNYPHDDELQITLVEGSIKAYNDDIICNLSPNQQLSYNKKNKKHSVETVNIEDVILWKTGTISFEEVTLQQILNVLGKNYGITYDVKTSRYNQMKITGVLDINKELNYFMNQLKLSSNINYKLKGNHLVIE